MSFFNHNAREIHCKIVYFGPPLGGKTTNIQWLYNNTAKDQASKLISLNTQVERTLFFDFLPLGVGRIHDYQVRFHVYSVPGQVVFDSSRRLILKGVDGVIFVADSQKERLEENLESLKNLEHHLSVQGLSLEQIPWVLQYNKRDLPNVLSVDQLRSYLNRYRKLDFEAVAAQGIGVMETFSALLKQVVHLLKQHTR